MSVEDDVPKTRDSRVTRYGTAFTAEAMVTFALLAGVAFHDRYYRAHVHCHCNSAVGLCKARGLGHGAASWRMRVRTAVGIATPVCMHGAGNDQQTDH